MEETLYGKYRMNICGSQFRLSTDSMVLADFIRIPANSRVLDLGCGCGTLDLLLLGQEPSLQMTGVEIQREAAAAAEDNLRRNGFAAGFSVISSDLREHRSFLAANSFDAVISNPPYYPPSRGRLSADPALAVARSELSCTLPDLCRCTAYALRFGGSFTLVHKPERLADLICALRAEKLEPKRIRFVRHKAESPVSLVLLEARLGGRPGLYYEPDLVLFHPDGTETNAYRQIYHTEDTP